MGDSEEVIEISSGHPGLIADGDRTGTERASARLHALAEIARMSAGAAGLDDLLRVVAAACRTALDASSLSLSVWERDQARVRVLLNDGELGPDELPTPLDEVYRIDDYPQVADLFERGVPYLVTLGASDAEANEFSSRLLATLDKHCCLGVPVVLEGRVWGELFVTRTVDRPCLTPDDVDYATAVAGQVGAAIAQVRHFERVAQLAYTDPLTGLANRRAIDERMDRALARHSRSGDVVSLIVVDVNGLKRINDERGHEAGDRTLAHFAGLLAAAAGALPGSLTGRTGGDEFCVIIEGYDEARAVQVAEDVCRRASDSLHDGVACGVASTGPAIGPVDSPARLFRLADAAQARAKRSRARVPVVAGRSVPTAASISRADQWLTRPPGSDRRLLRGHLHEDPARLLEDVLATLDQSPSASVPARLEVVADAFARIIDSPGWWLSRVAAGSPLLCTHSFSVFRIAQGARPEDAPMSAPGAVFDLGQYPVTAAAVAGGATVVAARGSHVDPGELAVLDAGGYDGVVMAGGRDAVGDGWLVEVFTDEISSPVDALGPALRAAVACAMVGADDR